MQVSSLTQSQLEIWYRGAVRAHQRRHLRWHLQARGYSDPKNTKWGMKQERWDPVPIIKKKALLSTTELRTPKRGTWISDREQHRGRPVPTIEGWDAGTGLETKWDCGTIYHSIDSDSEENMEKAPIHEFEENQGFMVFSSLPLNIDMKMIRSSNFSRSMFLRFTSS